MNIPAANPGAFVRAHRAELLAAVERVMDSGRYVLGPETVAFEQEFAAFVGVPHAIAVANGTEALWLAMKALDIGPGDKVITVSLTAVGTVAAIVGTGATPVFVDVCPDDLTLDPQRLDAAISPGTQAIIPVHLYGQAARLPEICALARQAGIPVIEDCAQAHGATCVGGPVGSWGLLGAFSFYPTKNLGGLGDGGAITTRDTALAERLRELREYGWFERHISRQHGWNSRLDELQAALLRVRLRHLPAENAWRQAIAAEYTQALAGSEIQPPPVMTGRTNVFHQYVVRHPRRDNFRRQLAKAGISTAIHYPVPVHLQPAYREIGVRSGSLANTERAVEKIVSLPVYPQLTREEVGWISARLREC